MKGLINILFILSLLGCSNNESEQLEGHWTGSLIYGIEEAIPFDSTRSEGDLLALKQQLGGVRYYEQIILDSIVFIIKEDSILTNAETGEFYEYFKLDSDKPDELLLYNNNNKNIVGFRIIRFAKDSLVIEPSMKPISLGKSQVEIVRTEYRLRKK